VQSTLIGLAVAFSLVAAPALAQSAIPTCQGIAQTAPADGKNFVGTRPILFSWSGEPAGTVSRQLHLATVDGEEVLVDLDGRYSDTVKVKMNGDIGWIVVFLDRKGAPICATPGSLMVRGTAGGKAVASLDSLSGSSAGYFLKNGRLVVVLRNSPYAGSSSIGIDSDSYNASSSTQDLINSGAQGVEVHGNNQPNFIVGSAQSDLIYSYGGNDVVRGGPGRDEIHYGKATNLDISQNADGEVDTLYFSSGLGLVGASVAEFPGQVAATDPVIDKVIGEP
jgi:hypothetical protein